MTAYTVKASGGDFSSLNSLMTAIANGSISDAAGHTVTLYTIGTEPSSYSWTGSGAGSTRVNPITISVATPAQNGGTALDLQITKAATITSVRSVHWDNSGSGASRLRWRGFWTFDTCTNWSFTGDRTQLNSGPGDLDGDTGFYGNLFVQYGHTWRRICDDVTYSNASFIMRKSGTSTGERAWSGVQCLKIDSAYGSAQARPSDNWLVEDCEFAYYANDGFYIGGLKNSTVRGNELHHLYPTYDQGTAIHHDGIQVQQAHTVDIDGNYIHHVLYQAIILAGSSLSSSYTADNTTYDAVRNVRVINNRAHNIGGGHLPSDLDPVYASTGGTGLIILNVNSALIAHNVFAENFQAAGLNHFYRSGGSGYPAGMTTPGDMEVDYVNNVFTWCASIRNDAGGTALTIGDPGFDGTWKNNLQLQSKATTSTWLVVPFQANDLTTGTNPLWDANYKPLTGSPLIDAGYAGAVSTGLALPTTDYLGVTHATPRTVGAYDDGTPSAPTLTSNAGTDISGAVINVAAQLNGADSTVSSGTITYLWSKVSGSGTCTFSDTAVASPTVTIDATGAHVLRLTVSTVETPGTTDTDDVTVTVVAAPAATTTKLLTANKVVLVGGVAHVKVV